MQPHKRAASLVSCFETTLERSSFDASSIAENRPRLYNVSGAEIKIHRTVDEQIIGRAMRTPDLPKSRKNRCHPRTEIVLLDLHPTPIHYPLRRVKPVCNLDAIDRPLCADAGLSSRVVPPASTSQAHHVALRVAPPLAIAFPQLASTDARYLLLGVRVDDVPIDVPNVRIPLRMPPCADGACAPTFLRSPFCSFSTSLMSASHSPLSESSST